MNFIQACKKKKKVYISSDNKHEKIHMKGIFLKKNILSMGEQPVKIEVSVQP